MDEMWTARSAIAWSAIGTWKLMMIGLATPTMEPLTGLNVGGRNGGSPVNGVGSCPAAGPDATGTAAGSPGGTPNGSDSGGSANGSGAGGPTGAITGPGSPGASSGSARAGPAPRTSTATTPNALKAATRLPLVRPLIQRDILFPSGQILAPVWHSDATV